MSKRFLLLFLAFCPLLVAQFSFDQVELLTAHSRAKEGTKGTLMMDAGEIRFAKKDGFQYFAIPGKNVSTVLYSRTAGRRTNIAIAAGAVWPLFLPKHKRRYMVLIFDGETIEFALHKDNYRGILQGVERAAGLTMLYNQGDIDRSSEGFAQRVAGSPQRDPNQGTLVIESAPGDAQIEVNGTWIGNSPQTRNMAPGNYVVRLKKRGYKAWEKEVQVTKGEPLTVMAEMESE